MSTPRAGILGLGYFLPANIRTNDDPIFDWIKAHVPPGTDLFQGYDIRHVLSGDEKVSDLMVAAGQRALDAAGLASKDVDLVLGYASVSEYQMPNALARVHAELNLPKSAWVIPLNNEYANFNASLVMANAMIRTGQIKHALVVIGGNWSRYVDYHTPESVSAADGAAAAVVGVTSDKTRFEVVDFETEMATESYGVMFVEPDALPNTADGVAAFTQPYFHITQAGFDGFKTFGMDVPPAVVLRLLARNGLVGKDVTLIAHQTSTVLNDHWVKVIAPAELLQTLGTFANMTLANIPVNLAFFQDKIAKDHLVLMALGPELSTNAVLLRRIR